ncbi:MAG: hypothetical protein KF825_10600 [Ferruginibacter sp.]|nr:hypothetical protein [Ferruginibacter sp.]
MKKIIFILILSLGAGSMTQAQILKRLKEKAKEAVKSSTERSEDKVVDKAINAPADNITDSTLDRIGRKVNSIFKKKNKKENNAVKPEQENKTDSASYPVQELVKQTDSTTNKSGDQN